MIEILPDDNSKRCLQSYTEAIGSSPDAHSEA